MAEANKYYRSKIYKISSPQCDKFYIGSTTQTLKQRLSNHKSSYKRYVEKGGCYTTSYEVIKYNDSIIELIKNVKCENRKELEKIEGECIKEFYDRILNKSIAGRTIKEYREANKEKIKEKIKEYHETNKEKIKDKKKEYRETNKEKIKEYYQANKEKIKEYRETNKEKIKEYYEMNSEKLKEYRETNKEKIKEYYQANKEKLLKKFNCECGGKYIFSNKSQHTKSKIHQLFIS